MFSLRNEYVKRLSKLLKELESYEIEGLNSVIIEIKCIDEEGFYENIYNAFYQSSGKFAPETKTKKEKYLLREGYLYSKFQKMGFKNLDRPPLPVPLITDLICFPTFFTMYLFLESVYYVKLGKPLDYDDLKTLYNSRIDEQLAYNVDEFDKMLELPSTTDNFFIKLKSVKWENRASKQLFNKLKEVMKFVRIGMFGYFHIMFSIAEKDFILFIAACSAIKDKNDRINQENVVTAYKTYFKLIKTDITEYKVVGDYKSQIKSISSRDGGYLVCERCNGYYKLEDGEFPEDFDKCQCGWKLKYYENISEFDSTRQIDVNG
ncbi:MAG: hypothetical protein KO217_01040 [Methanobacteriaceae archaeon]|jgi:hypothetical protein|nr:hypothetical protein [Methanobacteriaceae archaeon]